MSAQVTEAHRELARRIMFEFTQAGTATASDVRMAAQIIADSEAKATEQLRQQVANLTYSNNAHRETAETWRAAALACAELRAELATCKDASDALVESLRAEVRAILKIVNEQTARAESAEREVERLNRDYDYDHKCLHEVRERCELWKQRAELAEASLHALRLVCGTTDADKFSTWVDRANARAERAEADADSTRERALTLANSLDEAQAELAAERARLDYMSNCGFEHLHNETGDHLGHEWTISSYGGSHDVTLRDVIDAEMKEEAK